MRVLLSSSLKKQRGRWHSVTCSVFIVTAACSVAWYIQSTMRAFTNGATQHVGSRKRYHRFPLQKWWPWASQHVGNRLRKRTGLFPLSSFQWAQEQHKLMRGRREVKGLDILLLSYWKETQKESTADTDSLQNGWFPSLYSCQSWKLYAEVFKWVLDDLEPSLLFARVNLSVSVA